MRMLIAAGALALGTTALPLTSAHASSTWVVDISANRATAMAGGKHVVFSGRVHPGGAAAGEKVVLQEKFKPGAKWVTQSRGLISSVGKYRVRDTPTTNTRHAYRVVMPATKKHARGVSPTVKVTVYGWEKLVGHDFVDDDFMSWGDVDINGKTFENSVYAYDGSSQHIEYNLDHKCTKFRARFGISDSSTTSGQAEVDALSDGTNVYSHIFDLGQSEQKTVALGTPLKLRLEAHSTGDVTTDGFGAFATAQVLCTQ